MVVFDMAGTTINENNVVYKTLHKTITDAGFPVSLHEVLAEGAGKEKRQAVKSVLAGCAHITDDAVINNIYEAFLVRLEEAYKALAITPQPNAEALFRALRERNMLIVLNTGYNRATAQSIIEKIGWNEGVDFDSLVTASDISQHRPHPDMILFAIKHFGIENPTDVVKVGDSITDIQEGKNAGCGLTVGITTGAHTVAQLQSASPDYIIDNLIELLPLLTAEKREAVHSDRYTSQ